jgi:hypothetical protein
MIHDIISIFYENEDTAMRGGRYLRETSEVRSTGRKGYLRGL